MFQTLNEIAIYHIKIFTQHEKAQDKFLEIIKKLNFSLKSFSMHYNDEDMLFLGKFYVQISWIEYLFYYDFSKRFI